MSEYTPNEFLYKPALNASGPIEKTLFDEGLGRVDARLGQEIWIGDPKYPTFDSAQAASGNRTIHVPSDFTINITTNTLVTGNNNIVVHPGAKFNISAGAALEFKGSVYCLGTGPFFSIATGGELYFNGFFSASSNTTCFNGGGGVFFNRDVVEKVTQGNFDLDTGWIKGTGWTFDGTNYCMTHTVGSSAVLSQNINHVPGSSYVIRIKVTNYSAGNFFCYLGGVSGFSVANDGVYQGIITPTNGNYLEIRPSSTFAGAVDNISVRLYRTPLMAEFYPQWWGAIADGATDCSPAIQAAINAAADSGGGEVILTPGYYAIASRINIKSNVVLRGSGPQTVIKLLTGFPNSLINGYGAFGLLEDISGSYTPILLREFTIDLCLVSGDVAGIWFNKEGWKIGAANLSLIGNKNHQGIVVPEQKYSNNGIAVGHANRNHCIFENINFVGFQHANGAFYVEANNDVQNWIISNIQFYRCALHLNFGGLNSTIDKAYFNSPSGAVLLLGSLGGVSISTGGSGYTAGDVLTITGGSASVNVITVDGTGAVTGINLKNGDSGYSLGVKSVSGGTGTGCQLNITALSSTGKNPRVRFTNSSGPNTLNDCYFEGGPDIYVWGDNYPNTTSTNAIYRVTGRTTAFSYTSFLNTVRNPITAITRIDGRSWKATGNLTGNPFYIVAGSKIWVESNNDIKLHTVKTISYSGGESTVTINDLEFDLDTSIIKIYVQLSSIIGNLPLGDQDYFGKINTNRLIVGNDYAGNEIKQIRRERIQLGIKTIAKGTTDTIFLPLGASTVGLDAFVWVSPPRNNAPSYINIKSAVLNTTGNIVTVTIENNSATTDWIITNTYWNVFIIY